MTVELLRLPTPEEAIINRRTSASQDLYDTLKSGGLALDLMPALILRCFEVEAWRERRSPNGARVSCDTVMEWIRAPFPQGLNSTPEIVEALLLSSKDKAKMAQALALWTAATRRDVGNPNRDPDTGRLAPIVDNVHDRPERPTGNTAAAGMRRIQKAVAEGNEQAATVLDEITSGKKSVHKGCQELGFRKGLDPAVKATAARDAAEIIVGNTDIETAQRLSALLRKAGAANVANQIDNIVDPAIMDARYG